MIRTLLLTAFVLASLCGTQGYSALAAAAASLDDCAKIDDDAARLRCYDEAAGRMPKEAPARVTPVEPAQVQPSKLSYLSMKWQLDEESRKNRFPITSYRQNYILPFTYNFTQDKQLYEAANPGTEIQDAEAKFQISLKMKLWEDILGTNMDLWVGLYATVPLAVLQLGILLPLPGDELRARDPSQLPDRHGPLRSHEKPVHPGRPQSPVQRPRRAPLPELEPVRGELRFRAG